MPGALLCAPRPAPVGPGRIGVRCALPWWAQALPPASTFCRATSASEPVREG